MFSVRLVVADYYVASPIPGLDPGDPTLGDPTTSPHSVPVIRIFGSTFEGQRTCLHLHGVFPYLFVPCQGMGEPGEPADAILLRMANSIDRALNVALGRPCAHTRHVFKILLVSGRPFYGYHDEEKEFMKIYFFNPSMVKRVSELLQGGAVMNKAFQPHEAHIPFLLQFFIDYNLSGMNMVHLAAVKFRRIADRRDAALDADKKGSPSEQGVSKLPNSQNHLWTEMTIDSSQWLGEDVPRQSVCELEVDAIAADILNRTDNATLHGNPGLQALWDDEKQRRRDRNRSSQIREPPSPERKVVEIFESEKKYLDEIREILHTSNAVDNEENVPQSQERPKTPAFSVEALHTSGSQEPCSFQAVGDETVIDDDAIRSVVQKSQHFGSAVLSTQHTDVTIDDSLVSLLAEMNDDVTSQSQRLSNRQAPGTAVCPGLLPYKANSDEEESQPLCAEEDLESSLQMSCSWDESPRKKFPKEAEQVSSSDGKGGMSCPVIPQLDGSFDEPPKNRAQNRLSKTKKKEKLHIEWIPKSRRAPLPEFQRLHHVVDVNTQATPSSLTQAHNQSFGHSSAKVSLDFTCHNNIAYNRSAEVEPRSAEVEPRSVEVVLRSTEGESKSVKVEPRSAKVEPRSAELEPRSVGVEPRSTELEPRSTKVEPCSTKVEPRSAKVEPRSTKLVSSAKVEPWSTKVEPWSAKVEPRSAKLKPRGAKLKPRGAKVEPRSATLEPRSTKAEPRSATLEPRSAKVEPRSAKVEPRSAKVEPRSAECLLGFQERLSECSFVESRSMVGGLRLVEDIRTSADGHRRGQKSKDDKLNESDEFISQTKEKRKRICYSLQPHVSLFDCRKAIGTCQSAVTKECMKKHVVSIEKPNSSYGQCKGRRARERTREKANSFTPANSKTANLVTKSDVLFPRRRRMYVKLRRLTHRCSSDAMVKYPSQSCFSTNEKSSQISDVKVDEAFSSNKGKRTLENNSGLEEKVDSLIPFSESPCTMEQQSLSQSSTRSGLSNFHLDEGMSVEHCGLSIDVMQTHEAPAHQDAFALKQQSIGEELVDETLQQRIGEEPVDETLQQSIGEEPVDETLQQRTGDDPMDETLHWHIATERAEEIKPSMELTMELFPSTKPSPMSRNPSISEPSSDLSGCRSPASLRLADEQRCPRRLRSCVLRPCLCPPSRDSVQHSLPIMGLSEIATYQEPFVSNPADLPTRPRDVCARSPKLACSVKSCLPQHESELTARGLGHWCAVLSMLGELQRSQSSAIKNTIATNVLSKRGPQRKTGHGVYTVITPCKHPPSGKRVAVWLQAKRNYEEMQRGLKKNSEPLGNFPGAGEKTKNGCSIKLRTQPAGRHVTKENTLNVTDNPSVAPPGIPTPSLVAEPPRAVAMPPSLVAMPLSLVAMPLSPVAAAPSPVAAAPTPVAAAPSPVAMAPSLVAMAPSLVATTPSPVATTPSPVATTPSPVAMALSPFAMALSPFAMALSPVAMAPSPFAMAPSPFAMDLSPVAMDLSPVAMASSPAAMVPSPVASSIPLQQRLDHLQASLNPAVCHRDLQSGATADTITRTSHQTNSFTPPPPLFDNKAPTPEIGLFTGEAPVEGFWRHSTPCRSVEVAAASQRLNRRKKRDQCRSSPLSVLSGTEKKVPKCLRQILVNTKFKKRFDPRNKSSNETSELEGPSLENTYGFKMSQQDMHNAKSVHTVHHIRLLSLEVHVRNRLEMHPDPMMDPVMAVCYCMHEDRNGLPPDGDKMFGAFAMSDPASGGMKSGMMGQRRMGLEVLEVLSEEQLFAELQDLVLRFDPDILLGYEVQTTSWGFLLERAAVLGLDFCQKISRLAESSKENHFSREQDEFGAESMSEIHIVGRIVLNVWRMMKTEVALRVYSFENVAFHVLHQRLPHYSFRQLTLWWNTPSLLSRWKVLEYLRCRVCGSLQLLHNLDLVGRTSELARLFGIQFYHVLTRGSQYRVESMMLRAAKARNLVSVSPSVVQRAKQRAPECVPLIMEPESRLYTSPVLVLDFQSLYPSIIIAYNYCFSTCLGRIEHLGMMAEFPFGCTSLTVPVQLLRRLQGCITVSPNGVAFVKASVCKGVLPSMLWDILQTRLMVKRSLSEGSTDRALARLLQARQLGLKLISNFTYGYTAANFSGRMPCIEVGDSIVQKARETLEQAIQLVHDTSRWGARVIYGDTDSMFVLLHGASKDRAFRIGQEIADAVTAQNPKPVKLKFEKVYLPCVLQTKKRYVGYMYESAQQDQPVFDAKGIETVRRDGCPAVSKVLERTIQILFDTKDVSTVRMYVQRQCSKLLSGKSSLQDLIFAKEYRGLAAYRPGACVPALHVARKLLASDPRAEPRVGQRVPYVIVNGPPGLPLIKLVERPLEVLRSSSLVPNVQYYVRKQLLPALHRVLSLIGVDVFAWYQVIPRVMRVPCRPRSTEEGSKSTIVHYFGTTRCAVCGDTATDGLCSSCTRRPQRVAAVLMDQARKRERKHHHLLQLCRSCSGLAEWQPPCVSLDCPVTFALAGLEETSQDYQQFASLLD
uniref:DNA polymerase zeta catalytic subunit isoform X3 n=1 Tax=Myxine glutinosa TaxID=7769 RepID=UPI00358FBFE1